MNQHEQLDYLIDYLLNEQPDNQSFFNDYQRDTLDDKFELFRGLCNVRAPQPISDDFLNIQDDFLTHWNQDRPLVSLQDLTAIQPQLYLWQGDITRLDVDAIVNAANSRLLGCTQANHTCIDNIIHTRAGVQLRLACEKIIQTQGRKEPVGKAKITQAYNLPANYVIHTVGPYVDQKNVSPIKEHLLQSSYRSTLELAEKHQLKSIAFCCISTGEFNFPNQRAAEIAIKTVKDYLTETQSTMNVIFNVFKDKDLEIYQSILEQKE
ncbi:MAG TPA: protein-ADP-ribose hydrolase [Pseudogracilibacillus sp.]|nr:protein-ADP-ribose hydrolase [Pseudogracilibacillus sp.]